MKAAVVHFSFEDEMSVRGLILAAQRLKADEIELWEVKEKVPLAEYYLPSLLRLCSEHNPKILLFASGILGDALAVRLGCALNGSCASAVTDITIGTNCVVVERLVLAYQLIGRFQYNQPPYVFSVVKGAFTDSTEAVIEPLTLISVFPMDNIECFSDYEELSVEGDENSLTNYSLILIGGRGVGSRVAMQRLLELGERLGAGVGVSRPAVLNGWLRLNRLVGVSGESVQPKILVTFGISGCAPFIRGVEKSKLLIAVNTDPDAAIWKHCDIGVMADCNEIIEALAELAGAEGQ